MKAASSANSQLIEEISFLKQKIKELEHSESNRKFAEEALRRSEENFRRSIDESPLGVRIVTKEGEIIYANRAILDMHGYDSIEEYKTTPVEKRYTPESFAGFLVRKEKRKQGNYIPSKYEIGIVRKDGEVRHLLVFRKEVLWNGERQFQAVYQDITERKQMEMDLKLSEEKFSKIFQTSPDWITLTTLKEGTNIDVNEAFLKMTGFTRDEVIGRTSTELGLWVDPDTRRKAIAMFEEQGSIKNHEVYFRMKSGQVRAMLWSAEEIDIRGTKCFINSIKDITGRKQMEEDLLRAQKMDSLGILAGGIAHDFNNLMTVVLGNVQLAMMGLPVNHTSYPLLRAVLQSAEQTKDLTGRLITFSKGGFPVKQLSDVSEVLQEVVRKMVKRTGVRVTFGIEKDLWTVKADETQIRQVFYNLTMNAVEAMPEGGTLTIQAQNTKVHSSDGLPLKEGSYLRITFADNGKGIAEENLVRIFDPYFTTKGMGANKGVGLGLSVCYSVLKKHDGHIAVASRPGKGTAFTLYLPALAEKTHTAKIEQEAPSSSNRVLIMEDEIHVRALERAFLERLGYEVTETGDGREAIDRYKEALLLNNPFDLVILDLTVRQGLGGQMTMERLLKEDPSVKAIIASGYVDEPAIEHYKDYGFRGALKKPFSFYEFEEMVKAIIEAG